MLSAVKLWVSRSREEPRARFHHRDNGNGWDFDTSEADAVENRPMLTITFTAPAAAQASGRWDRRAG